MLTKRIIPCLDVKDNRVVKGVNFLNLRDAGDPVELGARYSDTGADELVFLDITATIRSRKTIVDMVRRVAENVFIPFTVGGGISDGRADRRAAAKRRREGLRQHRRRAESGPHRRGRPAVRQPVRRPGHRRPAVQDPDRALAGLRQGRLGADGHRRGRMGQAGPGTGCRRDPPDQHGRRRHLAGYDNELNRAVSDAVNIPVIASGGAGTLDHLYDAIVVGGADAVLMASITHFGDYTIRQMKEYLRDRGLPMNL